MRAANKDEIMDEPFRQTCAHYEENYRRLREACQKQYPDGNAFEKVLAEFKESLKKSALGFAFKIEELYVTLLAERNPVHAEIQELAELMNAATQCFEASKSEEVFIAFDHMKIQSLKMLENKIHPQKVKLGAASTL